MSADPVDDATKLQDDQQRLLDLMKEHIELECQGPSPARRVVVIDSWPLYSKTIAKSGPSMRSSDYSVMVLDEASYIVGADFSEIESRVLALMSGRSHGKSNLFNEIWMTEPPQINFAEPADCHTTETRRTALKLKHSGYNDRHTHPTRPDRKSKGKVTGWRTT